MGQWSKDKSEAVANGTFQVSQSVIDDKINNAWYFAFGYATAVAAGNNLGFDTGAYADDFAKYLRSLDHHTIVHMTVYELHERWIKR